MRDNLLQKVPQLPAARAEALDAGEPENGRGAADSTSARARPDQVTVKVAWMLTIHQKNTSALNTLLVHRSTTAALRYARRHATPNAL
jgi:hypothetical protein